MASDRVERLRPIYAEWAKGNLGAATELLAPELVYSTYSPDGIVRTQGLEEFGRFVQAFLADWDDYRIEAHDFLSLDADAVLVVGRHYGSGRRSGVAVDDRLFNVWVFRGDEVVGLHFHTDRESALRAAGLRA